MLGSIPVLLCVADLLESVAAARVVGALSYSSYALYLLHRVLFLLALELFFPRTAAGALGYLAGVVLPFTILVAYGVQLGYDRLLNWGCS